MKTKLLLTIALFAFLTSFAKDVDVTTAMNVAKNFYAKKATVNNSVNRQNLNLSLAYQCKSESAGESLYYIFNVNTNDGFVIVSGDDNAIPILGYTNTGAYNGNNLPPGFVKWMASYKDQIVFAKTNILVTAEEIKGSWNELISGKINNQERTASITSVSPLLQNITWDQGNGAGFYNDLCPVDPSLPDAQNNTIHCPTGCPATAMAQIMKYWSYPATGTGFHSYNTTKYGTLSANFGSTNYNWSAMPDAVTSSNIDVATLMYDCGVSVEMQYGPDDSGALVIASDNPVCSQNAYVTYFGYEPSTIQGLKRDSVNNLTTWVNLLENELNNNRPIQYAGFGSAGGHTFVCDGYDSNNNFHMNWGWGGQGPDGYYALDALNPPSLGTGGGAGGFNSGQEAVIGIRPALATPAKIIMYSAITVTPNPISFDQSFTVNADVYNAGGSDFNGYFCSALFDSAGNFINYIQIDSTNGNPLTSGSDYSGGLTFSDTGLFTVPGKYIIGIYYKPTGGNWQLSLDTNGFTNPITVQISSPTNQLELYSTIAATPTTFIQGQPAMVNVNFLNNNSAAYFGTYEAALYDLKGNFVENIGTYNETTGLASGNDYSTPYITFNSAAITATPGSYILGIIEEAQGDNTYYYAGGDSFPNPININIIAAPLLPDIYEPNNTADSAYNLPLIWSSDTANPQTPGSNINIASDIDYYQITLPSGYNYTITGRVDDSYDSNNGNTYTCDVLVSDSVSGGVWSDAYDPILPDSIFVNDSGTVTFLIAPYFPGQTGTYLLDIHITRTFNTAINEVKGSNKLFEIYPNPTSKALTVKNLSNNSFDEMRIINCMGQIVSEIKMTSLQSNQIVDVSNLTNGIYCLEAVDNDNNYSTMFIIHR